MATPTFTFNVRNRVRQDLQGVGRRFLKISLGLFRKGSDFATRNSGSPPAPCTSPIQKTVLVLWYSRLLLGSTLGETEGF